MEQVSSTFPFQDGLLHFCPVSTRQQTAPPLQESDHINNPILVFDDLLKESNDYNYYHNNDNNNNISDEGPQESVQKKMMMMMKMKNPNHNNYNQPPERKIMRRDVERQRRKEMGGLYKSLVTLIPYDYIKGKRSTSDRLQETVRYVKDLRKRVEKIRARRDELKGATTTTATMIEPVVAVTAMTLSSSSSSSLLMKKQKGDLHQDECRHDDGDGGDDDDEMVSRVMVKPCRSGVEITLTVIKADGVSLSKILDVLLRQGMSVNTCSSVKLNHRLFLTIQAEVVGGGTVDPTQVEQHLSGLVHPNHNNNNHGPFSF